MRPIPRNSRHLLLAVVASAIGAVCLRPPVWAETALDAFVEGERLMVHHRRGQEAIAAFERAAALDPEFAAPHYHLGELYGRYMDGRPADAERAMTEGAAFVRLADPRNPADRQAMLRTLDRLASGTSDGLALSSIVPIDGVPPGLAQRIAWRQQQVELGGLERYGQQLVYAYLDAGQFDRALAVCDRLLGRARAAERAPSAATAPIEQDERTRFRSLRLRALVRAGRWQDELAARQRAAAQRPDDPAAHHALAEIYVMLNRTRAAVKARRRAVALDPGDVDGHLQLAELYRRLGWERLVEQELIAVLEIDPNQERAAGMLIPYGWDGLRREAQIGWDMGGGGGGTVDVEAVLPVLVSARRSDLMVRMASGLLNRGDIDGAIRVARKAMEIGSYRGRPWETLFRAYVKAGRAKEIQGLVEELGRLDPAQFPALVDSWAGAIAYDDRAWPELATVLDSPYLTGDQRMYRFRDYARKLGRNDRLAEAIEVLERALSPRERLSIGNVGPLYEALVGYYVTEAKEREDELLGPITMPARIVGLYDKPIAVCQRYVDDAPFSAASYLLLARTYRDAGRRADAEAAYRRAAVLATDEYPRGQALAALAEILRGDGRAAEAVRYLRDPDYLRDEFDTRLTLIETLVQAGQADEARAVLAELFAFLSRRSYWWGGSSTQDRLFEVVKSLEGEAGALRTIQEAFDDDPSAGPLAQLLIGRYKDAKQYSALAALAPKARASSQSGWEAIDNILRALRDADEDERRAEVALDLVLSGALPAGYRADRVGRECVDGAREAGKVNDVGTRVEAEFAEDSGNVALGSLLAGLYEAADRDDDAFRVRADLAARYPYDQRVLNELFSKAADHPERDEVVLPHLEPAVARQPASPDRHVQLAGVYGRAGRDAEAAAEYALAFETEANPIHMRCLADEFQVHERLNTVADLVKRYEQFAADWPEDPVAHLAVGLVYRQADRGDDAIAKFGRASELAAGNRNVRRRLSEVYRELEMPDDALAQLKMLVDEEEEYSRDLEPLREYVALCREMKRYREALAVIDDYLPKVEHEDWMARQVVRLRQETVDAMEAEPPPPPRLRLLLSVRRLWECAERDLAAGTDVRSRAQAVLQGWVDGDPEQAFAYEAAIDIAASGARGDGTTVITCGADRCQAEAGGLLPLPGGRAAFRHAVVVDEGTVANPADGCLVTRRLAPIGGGRHRCTVTVRVPWPARVSLSFPAGASIVGDGVEGAAGDGERFVAVIDDPAAMPATHRLSAALMLARGATDYAPEVIVERLSEPQQAAAGGTLKETSAELDFVRARIGAQREFTLDRYDTEMRWALRMAPIAGSGR